MLERKFFWPENFKNFLLLGLSINQSLTPRIRTRKFLTPIENLTRGEHCGKHFFKVNINFEFFHCFNPQQTHVC
jgi:hypothetical protein